MKKLKVICDPKEIEKTIVKEGIKLLAQVLLNDAPNVMAVGGQAAISTVGTVSGKVAADKRGDVSLMWSYGYYAKTDIDANASLFVEYSNTMQSTKVFKFNLIARIQTFLDYKSTE